MKANFTFLGTGSSGGVPHIGCSCQVCRSSSPCNSRLRSCGLLHIGNQKILIDVGPDFRQQALRYNLSHLDGLLITHAHYDHIAGVDELRVFNFKQKKGFPCLLSQETFTELKVRYPYIFQKHEEGSNYKTQLDCHLLPSAAGEIPFLGIQIQYMSYFQGTAKVNGYRLGNFAYVTDIRAYDESIFTALKGVRKLVLSALRIEPSPIHFTLDEAVAFARKVGAEQTWLTHLSHGVDHEWARHHLPPEVQPGCDGLTIPFEMDAHAR